MVFGEFKKLTVRLGESAKVVVSLQNGWKMCFQLTYKNWKYTSNSSHNNLGPSHQSNTISFPVFIFIGTVTRFRLQLPEFGFMIVKCTHLVGRFHRWTCPSYGDGVCAFCASAFFRRARGRRRTQSGHGDLGSWRSSIHIVFGVRWRWKLLECKNFVKSLRVFKSKPRNFNDDVKENVAGVLGWMGEIAFLWYRSIKTLSKKSAAL